MQSIVKHYLSATRIRRKRILPVKGRVLVRKGQEIEANDIIAEANLNPEYLLIDLARGLGVSKTRLYQVLQVKPGDEVFEGDLLAGPVGLTRRVVRAPCHGRCVVIRDGRLLLEAYRAPYQLKAGYTGEVVALIEERGAVIELNGALIQGVWGNGLMDSGTLSVLLRAPNQVANLERLDIHERGTIALAGHCDSTAFLEKALELPLRGLIFSSINSALVDAVRSLPIPAMVIEGFGKYSLNPVAFKLLSERNQSTIILNAECSAENRMVGFEQELAIEPRQLPEIVIPAVDMATEPTPLNYPPEVLEFQAGQQVRVISSPFLGRTGILTATLGSIVLANGIRAEAGEVQLTNGDRIVFPLVNLEILA